MKIKYPRNYVKNFLKTPRNALNQIKCKVGKSVEFFGNRWQNAEKHSCRNWVGTAGQSTVNTAARAEQRAQKAGADQPCIQAVLRSRAFGVPLRLALSKGRAAIEQGERVRALLAALLGGSFVDL
jgi:hypothetical protein